MEPDIDESNWEVGNTFYRRRGNSYFIDKFEILSEDDIHFIYTCIASTYEGIKNFGISRDQIRKESLPYCKDDYFFSVDEMASHMAGVADRQLRIANDITEQATMWQHTGYDLIDNL